MLKPQSFISNRAFWNQFSLFQSIVDNFQQFCFPPNRDAFGTNLKEVRELDDKFYTKSTKIIAQMCLQRLQRYHVKAYFNPLLIHFNDFFVISFLT